MIFCEDINENQNPTGIGSTFYINEYKGGYLYIYVDNKIPFKTEGIIVDFWKGNDYGEYVDTKNLNIQEQWTATYFRYTFTLEGDYKVMVYRDDQSHIVSGYVTIKYD